MTEHKNDMYGKDISARSEADPDVQPPIPAATVVLLRDTPDGVNVLMLKKNSKIAFGGMWVFPGGRIDDEDRESDDDDLTAARNAAVREAEEEAGIRVAVDDLVWFARWTPPPANQKRFTTWFFACSGESHHDISIDQGEITDHTWINPGHALERHRDGDIDLAPPTWITLHQLAQGANVADLLAHLDDLEARIYSTRVGKSESGERVAMWSGDAGYEAWDANVPGPRHRLVMAKDGFRFENDVLPYDVITSR